MKQKSLLFIVALFSVFAFGCFSEKEPAPKYVFLFIGDGMGLSHVTAAEDYLAAKAGIHGSRSLSFTQFPVIGLATTYSANTLVTCSSAAATALATGHKTNNGMLGVAPDSSQLTALTYPLHKAGYRIGIATSVSIDHATPGGFYACSVKRSDYYDIANQVSATGFEFFAGSGFIYPTGKNNDQPDVYEKLQSAGYEIFRGQAGAETIITHKTDAPKTILVQSADKPLGAIPYAIDRNTDDLRLTQITKAAIARLENPKGFFAMIEGGKIDWAAHENDGATVIREILDFSEAVQEAIDFYYKYPNETLIIVTADHETGGMTIGRDGKYAFNPLAFDEQTQSLSYPVDEKEIAFVKELNKKASCGWTTESHTGGMVPIYAMGIGSNAFSGKMDNTDIPKRISELMGVGFVN